MNRDRFEVRIGCHLHDAHSSSNLDRLFDLQFDNSFVSAMFKITRDNVLRLSVLISDSNSTFL